MFGKKCLYVFGTYILLIIVMFSFFANSVYAQGAQGLVSLPVPADVKDTKYETAVRTLIGLDLIRGNPDGSFEPEVQITRAEFVAVLVRVFGLEDISGTTGDDIAFNDVSPDYWAYSSIMLAAKLGFVNGYENGNFEPENLIAFEEAVKMLVTALGYEMYAHANGGYPAGYLACAAQRGISGGVEGTVGTPVKRGDIALMVYRSLDTEVMKRTVYGAEGVYNSTSGNTLLTEFLNIYKANGRVTGNSYTKLDADSMLKEDEVEIDGIIYKTDDTIAEKLLGYSVVYYYKEDKASGNKNLVYIEPREGKNSVLTLAADDINDFSARKYSYYPGENGGYRLMEAKVSGNADVIYNGKVISVYNEDTFKPKSGEVILLDSDNNGEYDVVFIKTYTNYVVQSMSGDAIYDKYNPNKKLDLNPDGISVEVSIKDKEGNDVDIKEIKEWDVLSVAESNSLDKTEKMYTITYSNSYIEGKISEIEYGSEDNRTKVTIENSEYIIADNYSDGAQNLKLNISGTFYLDAYNKIAAAKTRTLGGMFAYLVNAQIEGGALDNRVDFLLYNEDGEWLTLKGTKKVEVDGKKIEGDDIIRALTSKIIVDSNTAILRGYNPDKFPDPNNIEIDNINQLLVYEINEDEEIISLDLSVLRETAEEDTLNHISIPSTKYKWTPMSFAGKVNINTETKVFTVPRAFNVRNFDENLFNVRNKSYFGEDNQYEVDAFYTKRDGLEAEAVVVNTNVGTIIASTEVAYVLKMTKAINKDGARADNLYVLSQGNNISYRVSSSVSLEDKGLSEGDAVRYTLNNANEIIDIEKVFDISERKIYSGGNASVRDFVTDDFAAKYNALYCGAYLKIGKVMQVKVADTAETSNYRLVNYRLDSTKVYIYDSTMTDGKKLSVGVADDIIDEKHSSEYSTLYVYTKDGIALSILIIK